MIPLTVLDSSSDFFCCNFKNIKSILYKLKHNSFQTNDFFFETWKDNPEYPVCCLNTAIGSCPKGRLLQSVRHVHISPHPRQQISGRYISALSRRFAAQHSRLTSRLHSWSGEVWPVKVSTFGDYKCIFRRGGERRYH